MHPLELHHIGHAVDDMTAALETYERLFGAAVEHRETVPEQGVEAMFLRVGSGRIELLRPLAEDTPVGRFLASRVMLASSRSRSTTAMGVGNSATGRPTHASLIVACSSTAAMLPGPGYS